MFLDKVTILNTKAKQAELEGGIFTQNFANSLI
jgi:hypothetical protein